MIEPRRRQYQHPIKQQFRVLFNLLFNRPKDFFFLIAAVLVEQAKLFSHFRGLILLFRQQQFCRKSGVPHPTSGIDAGAKAKSNLSGSQFAAIQPGSGDQCLKAGAFAHRHQLHTPSDQRPVFTDQRHDVADGTDCGERREALQHHFIAAAIQRSGKFERNPSAAQLVKSDIIQPVGVDHSHRLWQFRSGDMMVGDNDIHPQFPGISDFIQCRRTIIDGNNQGNSLLMEMVDSTAIHAEPFVQPVRDIIADVSAHRLKIAVEDNGRSHAVAVIVTIHSNLFARFDRLFDPVDSDLHIRQQKRVFQAAVICQQCSHMIRPKPAGRENIRKQRRDSLFPLQKAALAQPLFTLSGVDPLGKRHDISFLSAVR